MTMTSANETVSMTSFSEEFEPEFLNDDQPTDLDGLAIFVGAPKDYVEALAVLWEGSEWVVDRVVTHRGHVYMEVYLPSSTGNDDVLEVLDRSIFHTAFCEHRDLFDEGHDDAGRFLRIPEGDWLYSFGFWGEKALFPEN